MFLIFSAFYPFHKKKVQIKPIKHLLKILLSYLQNYEAIFLIELIYL